MKTVLLASAVVILAGAAYAQDYGPTYDSSIHQSAGERDSRGTPKYNQERSEHGTYRERHMYQGRIQGRERSTTGAGSSFDSSGPYYDNSIHQSAGDRDSRGTPKFNNEH